MAKKLKGTLDFETDPFKHGRIPVPFASCIYFSEDDNQVIWSEKDCAKKTYRSICKLPKCELYAHNGGKFDFWFLLPYIDHQDIMIINGRIAKLQINDVTLIDSYLLIAEPLDKYQKTKINYKLFESDKRHKHKTRIVNYLIDDCRFLLELLNGFHSILSKKLTIGSAAIQEIKNSGVKIIRQGRAHDTLFRPFFMGGRTEAIEIGEHVFTKKKPGFIIDINSAYAHAMTHFHPHGKNYRESKKLPKSKNGAWFADIDAISNGALALKSDKGELTFPRGGMHTFHATGWEINAGLKQKKLIIKKIHRVLVPEKVINFDLFVRHHYTKRQEAKNRKDKIADLVHKKVGNSGYGKLALDPNKFYDWTICEIGVDPREFEDGENYEWYADIMDKSLWRRPASENEKEQAFYDVATAASITGFVRAKVFVGLSTVQKPMYCDTDSIFCARTENMGISEKELGAWKIEAQLQDLLVVAKKIYAATTLDGKTKTASKGARLDAIQIRKLWKRGEITWKNPAPTFSLKKGAWFVERKIKIR